MAAWLVAGLYLAVVRDRHLAWSSIHGGSHAEQAARRLEERTPDERLVAISALELEDRGRFHRDLARTGDPAHLEAVLAYAAADAGRVADRLTEVRPSLNALGHADAARAIAGLVDRLSARDPGDAAAARAFLTTELVGEVEARPNFHEGGVPSPSEGAVVHRDPFLVRAALLFIGTMTVCVATSLLLRLRARRSLWSQVSAVLARARQSGPADAAPLVSAAHGGQAVVVGDGKVAILPHAPDLVPIRLAKLVHDTTGQCGLLLEAGGRSAWVLGLEPIVRIWLRLREDRVPLEVVVAPPSDDPLRWLSERARAAVQGWLEPGELVLSAGASPCLVITGRRAAFIGGTYTEPTITEWLDAKVPQVALRWVERGPYRLTDQWSFTPAPTVEGRMGHAEQHERATLVLPLAALGCRVQLDDAARHGPPIGSFVLIPWIFLSLLTGLLVLAAGAVSAAATRPWTSGTSVSDLDLTRAAALFGVGVVFSWLSLPRRVVEDRVDQRLMGAALRAPGTTAGEHPEPEPDPTRERARPVIRVGAIALALGVAASWAFLSIARAHLGWAPPARHSGQWLDPYLVAATAVFILSTAAAGSLAAWLRLRARGAEWARVSAAVTRAREGGSAVALPLPGGHEGVALVLASGARAAVFPGPGDLTSIEGATLVADAKDARAALLVRVDGRTARVTDLEELARAWAQLQPDEVPVAIDIRGDETGYSWSRGQAAIVSSLMPGERLVAAFLAAVHLPDPTGMKYEFADLLVTTQRLGHARSAGVTFLGTPARVDLQPYEHLGEARWRLELGAASGQGGPRVEVEGHRAAVLLPLVTGRCPITIPAREARTSWHPLQTSAGNLFFGVVTVVVALVLSVPVAEGILDQSGIHFAFALGGFFLPWALAMSGVVERHLEGNLLAALEPQRSS